MPGLHSGALAAKEVMAAAGVPTAGYEAVTDVEAGMAAIERYPVVLKVDGLAAGKGVIIAETKDEAAEFFNTVFEEKRFGNAASRILIEEDEA